LARQVNGEWQLRFANNALNFGRIRPGDLVWRSHDPDLDRLVRPYLEPAAPVSKQPLQVTVTAQEDEPLKVEWLLPSGANVTTTSAEPLVRAQTRGISAEVLLAQLGRLGSTPYEIGSLKAHITGTPFAQASLLNQMRREAVDKLQALQSLVRPPHVVDPETVLAAELGKAVVSSAAQAQLHLLVRNSEQLDAALSLAPASITLDYLDLYGLKPSVERVKSSGIAVRVASPRILKPGEDRIVDFLRRLDAPLLVRSSGLLEQLQSNEHQELTGDFSLNAANSITARALLAQRLSRITPTHDLNAAQITGLAQQIGGGSIEAIVYQHLPVFHTEHCVFCRFLSTGTSYKDCGRPCEKHTVSLRDLNGREHPLVADVGCRNTVFGAEAQEASAWLDDWRAAGIGHFRLEFAHESAADVTAVTKAFSKTMAGSQTSAQLAQDLERLAPQGSTTGSLFVPISTLVLIPS
jgi:putative protease